MRIAMVGTRGVPARYGGFETCVEEVGARLAAEGHDVTVYCRGEIDPALNGTYKGMRLVHRPALRRRSLETLSHTLLSVLHLVLRRRTDVVLVFNAANAPFLPLLRLFRLPVATHVDGLEWKRAKWWGGPGATYYRAAEALAVRWSDALVSDAQGIADYYTDEFAAPTRLIAYGAPEIDPELGDRLHELGLERHGYHLVVARFEPENHADVIVDGYVRSTAAMPLVVVGSAPYADSYTEKIHALADDRVRLLGGVWDQELLDQLYAGALTYWHGHSVGGTNPSLLRAIGAQTAVTAFDVSFNSEVLGATGRYFTDADSVRAEAERSERDVEAEIARGKTCGERAASYDWVQVAGAYEQLCRDLVTSGPLRHRPDGRRRPAADTDVEVPLAAVNAGGTP